MINSIRRLKLPWIAPLLAGLVIAGFPALAPAKASAAVAITHFQGGAVPPVVAADHKGKSVRLSDWRGRTVIVNLWASWCPPCRAELPSLDRLAARYPSDLAVLAISNDADGWPAVDGFWKGQFPHLHLALANGPELGNSLGALGLPYSLVVDRDGREIARIPRGAEWDKGELAELIARSIAGHRAK